MTTYTMTGPDGKDYSIDGPPGATPQQVAAQMAQQHSATAQAPQQPQGQNQGGVMAGLESGMDTLTLGLDKYPESLVGAAVHGISPSQALDNMAANKAATAAANPIASGAGTAGGIVASIPFGGAVLRGAEAIPLIGKAAQAVRGMSAVPRLAATAATDSAVGAATGAISGDTHGGPQGAASGAEAGAVLGPLARPVVAGLGKLAPMFYRVAAGPTKAALSIIASKVGLPGETAAQTYQRVQNAVTEYRGSLGTTPAVSEVAGEPQARELSATIARKPIAAQTAADLQAQAAGLRQSQLSGAVTRGAPPATPLPSGFTPPTTAAQTAVEAQAGSELDKALAPIETRPVTPTAAQSKFLADNEPEIAAKLRGPGYAAARDELGNHVDQGTPLTVRGLETIRRAMSSAGSSSDPNAYYYRDLRDNVRDIGNNDPDYAKAMAKYGDQRRFASNLPIGAAGTTKAPIDFAANYDTPPKTNAALLPAAQAGQTTGLRTALSQRALQSPNAAAGLAEDLTENSALQQNVHKGFVPTEAARVLQAGQIANTSTRGMSAAVPRLSTETAESEANTGLATRSAGVVAHGGSTGIIASVAHHLIHNMNLPSGTALKVAQLAMDPKNTPAVLQYLAKRGTTAAQRHVFMNVVRSGLAAATGNVAGQASGAVDQ